MLGYIIGHYSKDIFNLPHLLIVRLKTKAKNRPSSTLPAACYGPTDEELEMHQVQEKGA